MPLWNIAIFQTAGGDKLLFPKAIYQHENATFGRGQLDNGIHDQIEQFADIQRRA